MMKGVLSICLFVIVLLTGWQSLVSGFDLPHYILPSPMRVVTAFTTHFWLILRHATVTFSEVMLGLIFGALLEKVACACCTAASVWRKPAGPCVIMLHPRPRNSSEKIRRFHVLRSDRVLDCRDHGVPGVPWKSIGKSLEMMFKKFGSTDPSGNRGRRSIDACCWSLCRPKCCPEKS